MNRCSIFGIILGSILSAGSPVLSQDVSFTASAPRVVRVGEQFRLNFVVNASPGAFNAPEITDFYVVSGPNQSTSQSFQIINGRRSSSVTITYTYYLQATGEGKYTIDPARVVVDGKEYQSNPVDIEVLSVQGGTGQAPPGGQQPSAPATDIDVSDELFVRLHTDRKSLYLGEHIIVTIKLYTRLQISGFGESEMPGFDGFWTQEIEAPTQLNLVRENINGRIYNTAMIRKVILFPQKTGEIEISPFGLETYIRQMVERPRSVFDDFFGSSYSNVLKLLKSQPVTISVKPLPAGAPADFSGSIGNIAVKAEIDKPELKTNDALTYRITISGSGNIQLSDAPRVNFPPDFESYDPKVETSVRNTDSGQTGSKTFEYLLIPRHAGNFRIPPVSMSFFEPRSGQYRSLYTEEFNLIVTKGEEEEAVSVVTGRTKEDLRIIGSDILFIKDHPFKLKKTGSGLFGSARFILLYGIPFILFISVLLVRRNRIKRLQNEELVKHQRASREARKRMKVASAAMKRGEEEAFYETVMKALEGYLADKLSISKSDLSKDAVREGLARYNVPDDLVEEYLELADRCEIAKYAPGTIMGGMEDIYKKTIWVIGTMDQNLRK